MIHFTNMNSNNKKIFVPYMIQTGFHKIDEQVPKKFIFDKVFFKDLPLSEELLKDFAEILPEGLLVVQLSVALP